jgi:hypothetical protein
MKDCNKKIYQKIREYLDTCLTPFVEIVIEYIDEPGRNLHQVVQYNRTGSGTWLGVVGNMFDFDFFDIKEVVSYVPLCNLTAAENSVVTIDEDDEDFLEPINTDHLRKIDVSEIKEGDYICIDGESSFCHTSYLKISRVVEQVTMEDGKIVPFLILIDEDGDSWSSLDGSCVNNPNSMYGVVGYYRYDENYSREKEREKTIKTPTCPEEALKLTVEDFFNQEWVKKYFEKEID